MNIKDLPIEIDTIFTKAQRTYIWNVYSQGQPCRVVRSDTAGHACDWVCRVHWISRLNLTARLAEVEENT